MLVDLLKEVDGGGYELFQQITNQYPGVNGPLQLGSWVSGYIGVGVVQLLAVVLFLARGRTRAAQASLAIFVAGVIVVEILRHMLGARRPGAAETWVDADEMMRSFPARGVFLFTLAGVLLIFAAWGKLASTWRRLLVAGLVVVLILGVALIQLMLQLHFVTDVVGGLFGGLALALLASRFFAREERVFPGPDKASVEA